LWLESPSVVPARSKRSQNESNIGSIFAGVHATGHGESDNAYPKEKVAEFVVEKLDVTSIPSAIRPKREKGKRRSAIMDM